MSLKEERVNLLKEGEAKDRLNAEELEEYSYKVGMLHSVELL